MKYYGQFNTEVDRIIHERYFKNKFNGISIEAGAGDGLIENCTKFFEENYNWKTINIEPLPNIFKKLEINRPNSVNLNIALSNNEDTKIIRNYKHPILNYDWGNASLNHTDNHRSQLEQMCGINNYIEHTVKCKTYKQIINELNITHLDLFVLDVEGHEEQVLEGLESCHILPDIFVIEHGIKQITNSNILNTKYKLDCSYFNNSYYIKL